MTLLILYNAQEERRAFWRDPNKMNKFKSL